MSLSEGLFGGVDGAAIGRAGVGADIEGKQIQLLSIGYR